MSLNLIIPLDTLRYEGIRCCTTTLMNPDEYRKHNRIKDSLFDSCYFHDYQPEIIVQKTVSSKDVASKFLS